MKVECINNYERDWIKRDLTKGKVYNVSKIKWNMFLLKDDNGEEMLFNKELFKVVN